jgi:hypothetical protein
MGDLLHHRAKIIHSNIWKNHSLVVEKDDDDDYDKEQLEKEMLKKYARSIEVIVGLLRENQTYLRDPYIQPHSSTKFMYSYFSTLLNADDELMADFEQSAAEFGTPYYTSLREIHAKFDYFVPL